MTLSSGATAPTTADREGTRVISAQLVHLPFKNKRTSLYDRSQSGDLVCIMMRSYALNGSSSDDYVTDEWPLRHTATDFAIIRSKDHGLVWDNRSQVITKLNPNQVRCYTGGYQQDIDHKISGGVGSYIIDCNVKFQTAVNKNTGTIYLVYITDVFRSDLLPQIALVFSRDGGIVWSEPMMVNRTPQNCKNPQALSPSIAINNQNEIAISYTDFRSDDKLTPTTRTLANTWLAMYRDNGSTEIPPASPDIAEIKFIRETCLSSESFNVHRRFSISRGSISDDRTNVVGSGRNFYAAFCAPAIPATNYIPPQLINQDGATELYLDVNVRSQPYFSVQSNSV